MGLVALGEGEGEESEALGRGALALSSGVLVLEAVGVEDASVSSFAGRVSRKVLTRTAHTASPATTAKYTFLRPRPPLSPRPSAGG